jgi:hypothetical protein
LGVLLLEQAEGFFGAELGDPGEVLDPQSVKNLSPFQLAFAQAQWAFNFSQPG